MKLTITLTGERPAGQTPGYFDPSMTTPVEASVELDTDNVTAIAETAETFLVRELGIDELPSAVALRVQLTETAAESDRHSENVDKLRRQVNERADRACAHRERLLLAAGLLADCEKMLAGQDVRRPAGFSKRLKEYRAYVDELDQ